MGKFTVVREEGRNILCVDYRIYLSFKNNGNNSSNDGRNQLRCWRNGLVSPKVVGSIPDAQPTDNLLTWSLCSSQVPGISGGPQCINIKTLWSKSSFKKRHFLW